MNFGLQTFAYMEIRQITVNTPSDSTASTEGRGFSSFASMLSSVTTGAINFFRKIALTIGKAGFLFQYSVKRLSRKLIFFSIMTSSPISRLGFPPKEGDISETNSSHKPTLGVFLDSVIRNKFLARSSNADSPGYHGVNKERRFPVKNFGRAFALVIIAIVVVVGTRKILTTASSGETGPVDKQSVLGAKATQEVNKDFDFPVKDTNGDQVASFKYTVESAELRDQIVVKGQTATAVAGRTFLVINLKITNEEDKPVNINTRDYVRLSVNGNKEEWLAPDIHNDPVEVQAISTKYTRVGFPVNDSDKEIILRVGEIEGDKQEMDLNLQ
jgi:hypothetical protein